MLKGDNHYTYKPADKQILGRVSLLSQKERNPVRTYQCPREISITFINLHTNQSRGDYPYLYKGR